MTGQNQDKHGRYQVISLQPDEVNYLISSHWWRQYWRQHPDPLFIVAVQMFIEPPICPIDLYRNAVSELTDEETSDVQIDTPEDRNIIRQKLLSKMSERTQERLYAQVTEVVQDVRAVIQKHKDRKYLNEPLKPPALRLHITNAEADRIGRVLANTTLKDSLTIGKMFTIAQWLVKQTIPTDPNFYKTLQRAREKDPAFDQKLHAVDLHDLMRRLSMMNATLNTSDRLPEPKLAEMMDLAANLEPEKRVLHDLVRALASEKSWLQIETIKETGATWVSMAESEASENLPDSLKSVSQRPLKPAIDDSVLTAQAINRIKKLNYIPGDTTYELGEDIANFFRSFNWTPSVSSATERLELQLFNRELLYESDDLVADLVKVFGTSILQQDFSQIGTWDSFRTQILGSKEEPSLHQHLGRCLRN